MNYRSQTDSRNAVAATLLRFALGAILLAHGLLKVVVFTLPGTAAWFAGQGYPGWLAYPVAAGEVLGGIALLLGILVRPVSLATIPIFLGVIATVAHNGWLYGAGDDGGWEFPALLVVVAAAQALLGPGLYALGPALRERFDARARPLVTAGA